MKSDCKLCMRRKTTCLAHMVQYVIDAWGEGMGVHLRLRAMLREEGRRIA